MLLRLVLPEISFAFHLAGEEIEKQGHKENEECGLKADQEFSSWACGKEVSKTNSGGSNKTEIH